MRNRFGLRVVLGALMAVALVAVPTEVDSFQYRYASTFPTGLAVGTTSASVDFTDNHSGSGSIDIRVIEVVIRNAGPNTACYNLFKTTATLASCTDIVANATRTEVFKRYAGGGAAGRGYDGISYISNTAESAVLHVTVSGVSRDPS